VTSMSARLLGETSPITLTDQRSKREIACLWQLSSDTGSASRLNAATLCLDTHAS
jgi:hypothetical protein